jgi:ribosomal protein S18 acetylase RimI-like enzyme
MGTCLVRVFEDSDTAAVADLWRRVFPGGPSWNHPESDIKRKLAVQRELFYVAEVDGRLVGTAMAGYDGHRGWVYYVGTDEEFRRQGVAAALMRRVEDGLRDAGCSKLNLQVRDGNDEAVEFYRTLGYVVEPRVSMAKRLDS